VTGRATALRTPPRRGRSPATPDLVAQLRAAAERGARTVALTALATGYGRLTLSQFGQGLADLVAEEFPPIKNVVIVVRRREDVQDVIQAAPGVALA
jgi:O-acetyl-ADP-ribose deacetylase (regulator of RNase III)